MSTSFSGYAPLRSPPLHPGLLSSSHLSAPFESDFNSIGVHDAPSPMPFHLLLTHSSPLHPALLFPHLLTNKVDALILSARKRDARSLICGSQNGPPLSHYLFSPFPTFPPHFPYLFLLFSSFSIRLGRLVHLFFLSLRHPQFAPPLLRSRRLPSTLAFNCFLTARWTSIATFSVDELLFFGRFPFLKTPRYLGTRFFMRCCAFNRNTFYYPSFSFACD